MSPFDMIAKAQLIECVHLEIIDLSHPTNVDLFRQWDQKEVAYIQQLRMIRISSSSPEVVVVSRPGKHPLLLNKDESSKEDGHVDEMDTDDAPLLLEPPSRFSSTMMSMDLPP